MLWFWTPIASLLGLIVAPVSLYVQHLDFSVVPWALQLHWHYTMFLYSCSVPFVSLQSLKRASQRFLPHLERRYGHRTEPFLLKPLPTASVDEFKSMGGAAGFKRRYFDTWLPVKLSGFAQEYGNTKSWSMARFAKTHGDVRVNVYNNHLKTNVTRRPFRDVAAAVRREDRLYARAVGQILKSNPSLLNDIPFDLIGRMKDTLQGNDWDKHNATLQFFSAKRTFTQVHADVSCNFNIQFEGRKRWVFFPPSQTMLLYPFAKGNNQFYQGSFELSRIDLKEYPCLKYARGFETVMRPGDMLWLPSWWWHGIENLDTPSCSVACDGVAWFGKLFSSNFMLTLCFFAHPSNLLDFTLLTSDELGERWRL